MSTFKLPKTTIAHSTDDVLKWIVEHKHHEGYWTDDNKTLILVGDDVILAIPVGVHRPGAMVPSDYSITGRMYEPAPNNLPTQKEP